MSSNKLPRRRIIRERRLLSSAMRTGSVVRTPYFRLHYERGVGPPGVAFLAGKRAGGAVKRNRARRVLRETFRTSNVDLSQVRTLVFVATEKTGRAPHGDIIDALDAALRRASDQTS